MNRRYVNYAFLTACSLVLTVGYANCAKPFKTNKLTSDDFSSLSVCEESLRQAFNVTYRPLLTSASMCLSCHTDSGVSPYKFASSNLAKGYSSFREVGPNAIDANAISATHAPGKTGTANAASFTAARASWDTAYASYANCIAAGGDGPGPISSGDLVMDEFNRPNLYFGDGRTDTVVWSLDSQALPVSARLAARFIVDIRVIYATSGTQKVATGYAFKNPRIEMLGGELELEVEGVIAHINGEQPPGLEPFLSARKVARGVQTILYNGELVVAMPTVSSGDKISFSFGYAERRPRTDNPPTPANATVRANNAYTRAVSFPITITDDGTARKYCVTTSSTKPASVSQPCPGYENATTTGWVTTKPGTLDLAPLGYVPQDGSPITFYVWVANSDLKLSAGAGSGTILYDITSPAQVTFTSLSQNGTQIADINGLTNSNETVDWCVKEGLSTRDVDNDGGCSWSATKPTFVALRGQQTRYVAVFVRDRATNVGPVSTIRSINNPYPRISFQQLSMVGDARGVFANRCLTCHGLGGLQQGLWNATSYADTVAKKDKIRARIENASNPMPKSGLLDPKERALIHLWFTQTSTPVEQ